MPNFFRSNDKTIHLCKTTPELYSYLFWRLSKHNRLVLNGDKSGLNSALNTIKQCITNHSALDRAQLSQALLSAKEGLGQALYKELNCTLQISCREEVSLRAKWKNPFYRNFESQLMTNILLRPTAAMINCVPLISKKVIEILKNNQLETKVEVSTEATGEQPSSTGTPDTRELIRDFLEKISLESTVPEAFGKIKKPNPSLEEVFLLLERNDPADLHQILQIHVTFARNLYRVLDDPQSQEARVAFIDGKLRGSPFFKDWRMTRGREFFFDTSITSSKMGLMLREQASDLPELSESQKWCPDAICQEPFFDSPYVQEILANDLVYISGPSGMTTLFLGMAELLQSLPMTELKESYALCCSVYLVSGGLHSWHEALEVAHDLLGYFPEYQRGKYQTLLDHFSQDPVFQENIEKTWDNFFQFCDKHFRYAILHDDLKTRYREYFESKLALAISDQSDSLQSVAKVSETIAGIIKENKAEVESILFKNRLIKKELYDESYFGCLHPKQEMPETIVDNLLSVLSNRKADLEQLIHIHSVFARHVSDELLVHKEKNIRILHIDTKDRGRVTLNQQVQPSNYIGIARHPLFNARIGQVAQRHFCGIDEFGPDLNSPFYLNMAGKHIPFISGKSGHTVKLLSGAKQYAFLDREEVKEYTLACFAYLTKGRNHGFHEVMIMAKSAGVDYEMEKYLPSFPQTFICSPQFQRLHREFPEFLEHEKSIHRNADLRSTLR